jgi:hypothetical protein
MSLSDIVQRGWDAVGAGDFDTLVADYVKDMNFIMPGQTDVLEGRQALDGFGEILPPGFEITGLRHIEGETKSSRLLSGKPRRLLALNCLSCSSSTATRSMRSGGSSTQSNGRVHSEFCFFEGLKPLTAPC